MSSAIEDLLGDNIIIDHDHVRDRVEDWKQRISDLFDDITKWFPELRTDRSDTIEMNEELMRKHKVQPTRIPVLRMFDHEEQVAKFIPIGLWIIGANGRLNLFAAKGQFVIVDRSEDTTRRRWEIAPSLRRLETVPLSRSTLLPAIR